MRALKAVLDAWTIPVESLGLWRLATGSLLLVEWSNRLAHLDPLYLHEGLRRSGDLMRSIQAWTGPWSGEVVVLLASAGVVSATAWTAGWMTRWAQGLAWGTFALFSNLNLMTGHAGDVFLLAMLLWTLPLPCGGAFSLDRRFHPRFRPGAVPFAGLAALGQISLVYGLAGLAKTGEAWQTGEAVARALGGSLGSGIGTTLVNTIPGWALAWVGRGLPWLEMLIAGLILCPWFRPWPRRAALGLLFLFQVGLIVGMDLGLLPWLMLAAGLLLIQPEDWAIWHHQPATTQKLPAWSIVWVALFSLVAFVSSDTTLRRTRSWQTRLAPGWLWRPLHLAQLHQDWGMFAPDVRPFRTDYRLEVQGACGTVWTFGDRDGSFLGASGKGWRKFIEQAAGSRRERERLQLLILAARVAARSGIHVRQVRLVRVHSPIPGVSPVADLDQETVVEQLDFRSDSPTPP